MNIACYLMKSDGTFKASLLPEDMTLDLIKSIREKGVETIHFADESILCEGIFIPAKDTKHGIMAIPNLEGDE